ncbi:hypothetical protein GIV25_28300, partial [Pseudomonas carnis]|nr:hypothetical protein [Pseudomonas carnis]
MSWVRACIGAQRVWQGSGGPGRTSLRVQRLMAKRDYYEVLGVERGASEADLK